MGIAYGALKFLMDEGRREAWHGRLLTLGRQDTSFTRTQLVEAAQKHDCKLPHVNEGETILSGGSNSLSVMTPDAFFRTLGFESITVLDASDYEGADIIHDLNAPHIPSGCSERFDLILDGGTLEHVFDVATALKTLCQMTAVGGRILHISPMSNCADHGFYSFSPTLFADYYAANRYDVRRISLVRFDANPVRDEWEYREYEPGLLGTIGELGPGVHFLMTCVRKTADSLVGQVPQQNYYRKIAWAAGNGAR